MSISKTLGSREYVFESQRDLDRAKTIFNLTQDEFEDMLDELDIDYDYNCAFEDEEI